MPAGTEITVTLLEPVDSAAAHAPGMTFKASVTVPLETNRGVVAQNSEAIVRLIEVAYLATGEESFALELAEIVFQGKRYPATSSFAMVKMAERNIPAETHFADVAVPGTLHSLQILGGKTIKLDQDTILRFTLAQPLSIRAEEALPT